MVPRLHHLPAAFRFTPKVMWRAAVGCCAPASASQKGALHHRWARPSLKGISPEIYMIPDIYELFEQ
jgi:hypothetical protein